jgi:sporulation protein YlmC with PRC-barrel domain
MMNEEKKDDILKDERYILSTDNILGKDVIDKSGQSIGVVNQVHIDKLDKNIIGISIDSGFMKPLVFVGIDLIVNFGVDSVYIQQTPRSRYIDMIVFDNIGVIVGKVKNVYFKDESFEISHIKIKVSMLKSLLLDVKYVKRIGRNIFLNISKRNVKILLRKQN